MCVKLDAVSLYLIITLTHQEVMNVKNSLIQLYHCSQYNVYFNVLVTSQEVTSCLGLISDVPQSILGLGW